MNGGILTGPYFQNPEPPSLRAPLRSFFEPVVRFILERLTASVTTGAIQAVDEQRESTAVEASLQRIASFKEALNDALELNVEMVNDGEGDQVDSQTVQYAALSLNPLIASMELPTPLVLPLQNGGIGAEWHAYGMNIELRFRKPYDVYAVLEDARSPEEFRGRDPDLERTRIAIGELGKRVRESTNPQVLANLDDEAS